VRGWRFRTARAHADSPNLRRSAESRRRGRSHRQRTLSGLLGETLVEIGGRLRFFDERIGAYDVRIGRVLEHDERCQRLAKVEGVGPLVATAMVAAVGNAREFKSGRELSTWLGLVKRQHSSGNRNVLLGISKRGDRYLRTLARLVPPKLPAN